MTSNSSVASIAPSTVNASHTLRAVFVDANPTLGAVADTVLRLDDVTFTINRQPDIKPEGLPAVLADAQIAVIDHTHFPLAIARQCTSVRHVVFLGTGPRSYMSPEELAGIGIAVHTIKGYGDTAVAECAIALMWAAARGLACMDREMRVGNWLRTDALQLTGRTIGLIGFGGIAAEVARLALGTGMKVLAWNRTPKTFPGIGFVSLDRLLAESDVVSLHLFLCDETKNFLSRERIGAMRTGAILVNTARGALVDEDAMIEALQSGHLRHAGLDVYTVEPMPAGHRLTTLPNVTLSAHSAFRTAEANHNLITAAREHCRRIAAQGVGGNDHLTRGIG
jgi:D-3-phosphoglycerate dehydrogenase / 2-oxoglutarate reductase